MDEAFADTVEKHWFDDAPGELIKRIDAGLQAAGRDPTALSTEDLLPVDEFHIRGREATAELAELAAFNEHDVVIDVGSGLGGPSRYLATRCRCRVTGIDLTTEYCDVARELAHRVGLADLVEYRPANALSLPFDDDHFTAAWTQHISMNIADKQTMYREMRRVVQPGGKVAIYDPISGSGETLTLPVPWAREPGMSFLIGADETRELLEGLGFTIETWRDVSRKSIDWFAANAARQQALPPLGLHLLLGADWPAMARNMVENLKAGRIAVVQIIARTP